MGRPAGDRSMVGRDDELAQITARLQHEPAAAFVIAGPAGVGKTRLAAEAGAAAVTHGAVLVRIAATRAASSIPFGPFARFLPAGNELPHEPLGLLHALASAVVADRAAGQRLVLVVDDAQLLDDGSAALVHELVLAAACDVIVTVRTPGATPDPVTALWKDGLAERFDLRPFDEPEVGALIKSLLGGPVAGATVRRLSAASGGNPLWVKELVTGAAASGALVDSGGMWTLRTALRAPDRLVEIVATRLAGLDDDTMGVLELLAAGEQLELALLEANAAGPALDDAERQGLVEIVRDGRRTSARLSHPVYGEVLRQQLPHSRQRRIWRVLAGSLQATGARRREDLLRLVTWQLDAGLPGDPALLSAAARLASRMSDKTLAARLARAAFDVSGGVEAGLALGVAEFSLGRHTEAEQLLAVLVQACVNDTELSKIADARAYNLSVLMGQPEAAAAVLEEALATIVDTGARLRLLGRLATNRLFDSQAEAALAAALPLLESNDPSVAGQGAYTASIAAALMGRADAAVELSERGMRAYLRSTEENHQLPEVQLIGAVLGNCAAGRLGAALADADTGYQACLTATDREGQATFSLLRGWVLAEQGHLADAAPAFLEGASINRDLKDPVALRWCLGGYALVEGMAGRAAQAATVLSELDSVAVGSVAIFELELIERARAWSAIADGHTTQAGEALAAAARRAADTKQHVAEAHLLHDLVSLGMGSDVVARLARLAELVDGELVATFADHARACERGAANEVASCVERFEALGTVRCAAQAAREAALLYRADGLARAANQWSARSVALFAACGGESIAAAGDDRQAARLTRREREIAMLAAAGRSSREIAAGLFVSVRTVDNHLQNAYTKLGVTNRTQLAEVLGIEPGPGRRIYE